MGESIPERLIINRAPDPDRCHKFPVMTRADGTSLGTGFADASIGRLAFDTFRTLAAGRPPRIEKPNSDKPRPWDEKISKLLADTGAWAKLRDFDQRPGRHPLHQLKEVPSA